MTVHNTQPYSARVEGVDRAGRAGVAAVEPAARDAVVARERAQAELQERYPQLGDGEWAITRDTEWTPRDTLEARNRAFDEVCERHPLPGDEPERWATDRHGTHWDVDDVIDDDTPNAPAPGGADSGATGSSATFTLAELVALDDAIDRGDDIAVAQILAGPDSRDEQPPWTPLPATTAQRMQADLPAREEQLQRWHADDHTLTPGMDERAAGWDR